MLSFFIIGSNLATAQTCPDLAPCTCNYNGGKRTVYCDKVAMEQIKYVFSNISPIDIDELTLDVPTSGDSIPVDLLGESRVINKMSIRGQYERPLLTVDPNAFRSSNNTLQHLFCPKWI